MKFQLIRKFNLTRLLIAAATLGLDYLFQAAHGKLQRAYPKHHRIKFLLAADRPHQRPVPLKFECLPNRNKSANWCY